MEGGFGGPAEWKLVEGGSAVGGGGASLSGGAGGSGGGWSDPAAEVVVGKNKRKNKKTRTQRGLDSWKLDLRAPAFEEFVDDGALEVCPWSFFSTCKLDL
jgi:hypothetical protein